MLENKKLIKNAESIISALSNAYNLLSGGDEFIGACSALQQADNDIASISEFSEKISKLSETLTDLAETSNDIMYDIRNAIDEFDVDINQLDEIEERLDTYYKLKRKYGGDVASVLEYYKNALTNVLASEYFKAKTAKWAEAMDIVIF